MVKQSRQSSRASVMLRSRRSTKSHSVCASSSSPPPPSIRRELEQLEERFPFYTVVPSRQADSKDAASNAYTGEDSIVHALYFGLEYCDSQKKVLDLKTVHTTVGGHKTIIQMVDFRSEFAFDFGADELYIALVIFQFRRYIVAGTYDKDIVEHNMSLGSVGCNQQFRGDIAVCFYGQVQQSRILRGTPTLSRDGSLSQADVLKNVLNVFVKNVKEHVEDGMPFKRYSTVFNRSATGPSSSTVKEFIREYASAQLFYIGLVVFGLVWVKLVWNVLNLVLQSHYPLLGILILGPGVGVTASYLLASAPLSDSDLRNRFPRAFILITVITGIWISIFAVLNCVILMMFELLRLRRSGALPTSRKSSVTPKAISNNILLNHDWSLISVVELNTRTAPTREEVLTTRHAFALLAGEPLNQSDIPWRAVQAMF
ncbi:hypothetical protein C8R42DRAFT_642796 [Lentinula raphanica]|nr:hypothetical protein C8R42DRAFT_642796 [Lentinula raphanica]